MENKFKECYKEMLKRLTWRNFSKEEQENFISKINCYKFSSEKDFIVESDHILKNNILTPKELEPFEQSVAIIKSGFFNVKFYE